MKRIVYSLAVASLLGFASCGNQSEQVQEDAEVEDEMRDRAEERTDDMEDAEEELGDTSAVIE